MNNNKSNKPPIGLTQINQIAGDSEVTHYGEIQGTFNNIISFILIIIAIVDNKRQKIFLDN